MHRRYRKNHPDVTRDHARHHKSLRRARAVGNGIERVSYRRIVERDGMVCHLCGNAVATHELSYDHIVPISRGGRHAEDNIKVAHRLCNVRRGNKLLAAVIEP
jgi:5-methylcytosine-specific restriction endonuclease McrA